jgi:hypothetical protein
MQEQALTAIHKARLKAQTERARARMEAMTRHADESMASSAKPDVSGATASPKLTRWGNGAFYFCIWFAMIAPIALILATWD